MNVESGGVNEADLVGLEQVGVGIAWPPDVNGVGRQAAEVVVLEGHKAEKRSVGKNNCTHNFFFSILNCWCKPNFVL